MFQLLPSTLSFTVENEAVHSRDFSLFSIEASSLNTFNQFRMAEHEGQNGNFPLGQIKLKLNKIFLTHTLIMWANMNMKILPKTKIK